MRSLGIDLDRGDSVRLWPGRSEQWACLVLDTEDAHCEIRLDQVHVRALRDYLPGVLAGLDRRAAEDAARDKAEVAGQRATDLAAEALDRAVAAEAAGAYELAKSLRAMVAEATEKADAVDAALRAFDTAAADADRVAEGLICATREAEKALHTLQGDVRPAELAVP